MKEPGAASPSGPEGAIALVSPAWLRHGPKGMFGSVEPGLLIAREGGRISFVTQREKVFEAERQEIGVNWPGGSLGQVYTSRWRARLTGFHWPDRLTRQASIWAREVG